MKTHQRKDYPMIDKNEKCNYFIRKDLKNGKLKIYKREIYPLRKI